MIILDGVRRSYPEFTLELDLEMKSSEILSLLGPSGSGKTTALRLIAGFDRPDAGRILVNEEDVTRTSPAHRRIGFVFQDYSLFPHMDVRGNIGYGLRVQRASRKEIIDRTDALLDLVDLNGYADRAVDTLSGGERQRVAIARALAVDPVVLLLDEPFSAIDEVLRRELRREILRLQERLSITILFVTHSRREALSVSDRIAILRDGRLEQVGTPREVYEKPANAFVANFVGETVKLPGADDATSLVRPEALAIVGPADSVEDGTIGVRASVIAREFLGPLWLYTMAPLDDADAPELMAYAEAEYAVGSEVVVTLPDDRAAEFG